MSEGKSHPFWGVAKKEHKFFPYLVLYGDYHQSSWAKTYKQAYRKAIISRKITGMHCYIAKYGGNCLLKVEEI